MSRNELIRGASAHWSTRRRRGALLLILVAVLIGNPGPLAVRAQDAGGTLSGKFTSNTGSDILNVHISIKNTADGDAKSLTANKDGTFDLHKLDHELTLALRSCDKELCKRVAHCLVLREKNKSKQEGDE